MCEEDFDGLYAVAADPLLWEQHPDRDRYRSESFRRFFDDALASGGALTVIDNDGVVIGSSRFHGFDVRRSEVQIGWTFLARSHWGGAAKSICSSRSSDRRATPAPTADVRGVSSAVRRRRSTPHVTRRKSIRRSPPEGGHDPGRVTSVLRCAYPLGA